MKETLTDRRIAAIESLLPWIGAHRDFFEMRMVTRRYNWVSKQIPGPPPPCWKRDDYDCDGRCYECQFEKVCGGLASWQRVYRWLRKAYRIGDIEDALADLSREFPRLGKAVIDVYVEPWKDWRQPGDSEPISEDQRRRRSQLARKGLEWLERHPKLKGEIVGYDVARTQPEYVSAKERRRRRNQRILEMWGKEGKSIREIAQELGCSYSTVQAVITGGRIREGRVQKVGV